MGRSFGIGITGILVFVVYVALSGLIMHFAGVMLQKNDDVTVSIQGDEFVISNRSSTPVGLLVISYENDKYDTAHQVQVWSLRSEEIRHVQATSLAERDCRITAICYNGEEYVQKEDS